MKCQTLSSGKKMCAEFFESYGPCCWITKVAVLVYISDFGYLHSLFSKKILEKVIKIKCP